ncbi:MAG TPA: hypothetical protein VMW94_04380 [Actinomycetes bacterium]|nr:hypothetical protein [Actinomycetes bacterium]
MTVTRTQFLANHEVASLANAVEQAIDIPRPQTVPQQAAYAEGSDHVVREPALREFEAGHVIIQAAPDHAVANVFLRKIEIHQLLPAAQKGLGGPSSTFTFPTGGTGPLFPSGAPATTSFVRTMFDAGGLNGTLLSDDSVKEILGGNMLDPTTGLPSRSYPGVTLRAGEFVRLTLFNNTGAAIVAGDRTYHAAYKLGQNQSDTGKP